MVLGVSTRLLTRRSEVWISPSPKIFSWFITHYYKVLYTSDNNTLTIFLSIHVRLMCLELCPPFMSSSDDWRWPFNRVASSNQSPFSEPFQIAFQSLCSAGSLVVIHLRLPYTSKFIEAPCSSMVLIYVWRHFIVPPDSLHLYWASFWRPIYEGLIN